MLRGQKNRLSESQEIFAIQLFKNKKYENGFMNYTNKTLRVWGSDIYKNYYIQMVINAFSDEKKLQSGIEGTSDPGITPPSCRKQINRDFSSKW